MDILRRDRPRGRHAGRGCHGRTVFCRRRVPRDRILEPPFADPRARLELRPSQRRRRRVPAPARTAGGARARCAARRGSLGLPPGARGIGWPARADRRPLRRGPGRAVPRRGRRRLARRTGGRTRSSVGLPYRVRALRCGRACAGRSANASRRDFRLGARARIDGRGRIEVSRRRRPRPEDRFLPRPAR